jgi:hypothetical protein
MIFWLFAILLVGSVAGLGFRQGVVRAAISFMGILLAGLLSVLLGHALKGLFHATITKNPVLLWILPPIIIFVIIMFIVKVVAFNVYRKVDVYYKHNAGDVRRLLWERLNHRLGLCVGLLNGTAYLLILSVGIYILSYWTYQISSPGSDPKLIRVINSLGRGLHESGFAKVARALDSTPASVYDSADVAALVYHNPLLEARVARYPAVLGLAERQEFQDLANDKGFAELRMRQAPLMELINYSQVQTILRSPDTLNALTAAIIPNLQDMKTFLVTGRSPRFESEKILGRWDFDVNGTLMLLRTTRTNISSSEMIRLRKWMAVGYAKTKMVASMEHQIFLKDMPRVKAAKGVQPTVEMESTTGEWRNENGKYSVTATIDGKPEQMTGEIEGDRLSLLGAQQPLAFSRED